MTYRDIVLQKVHGCGHDSSQEPSKSRSRYRNFVLDNGCIAPESHTKDVSLITLHLELKWVRRTLFFSILQRKHGGFSLSVIRGRLDLCEEDALASGDSSLGRVMLRFGCGARFAREL